MGALTISGLTADPRSGPRGQGVGNCQEEDTEVKYYAPLSTTDVGSLDAAGPWREHGEH